MRNTTHKPAGEGREWLNIKFKRCLSAFTLAEMLVVMIVSGIVLLSVFDGFLLFEKFRRRLSGEIMQAGAAMESYRRLEHLFASSDSICGTGNTMELFVGGRPTGEITIEPPLVIFTNKTAEDVVVRDTVLKNITEYRTRPDSEHPQRIDSLIVVADTLTLRFGIRVRPEAAATQRALAIEKKLAFDEDK